MKKTAPSGPVSTKAISAPASATTIIDAELIRQAVENARTNPRKRVVLPLHKNPQAPTHRMLNAIQPGSYIRPHRHLNPPKSESVIVLQGAILALIFSNGGQVEEVHTLAADSAQVGIDSEPGVYHTFLALTDDTVLFEVKPGPYVESTDKDFAPWAPLEGSGEAATYIDYLYTFSGV